MGISTMNGDNGTTDVIGGKRFPKDHPLIECLGTIDELNAFLGDAKAALAGMPAGSHNYHRCIDGIQKELITVSGIFAGSMAQPPDIEKLAALIAEIELNLPPFTGFAVPGTDAVSAKLHIARTVCRRLERRLVSLSCPATIPAEEYPCLLAWFNRLSDLLFLMAQEASARYR
jgi:cob(I)alamin adenosyltransferase